MSEYPHGRLRIICDTAAFLGPMQAARESAPQLRRAIRRALWRERLRRWFR